MSCEASSIRYRLLVGLGNPGERYRETRHNVGFRVLDRLAARAGTEMGEADDPPGTLRRADLRVGGQSVLAVQPGTYMNRSGAAVEAARRSVACDVNEMVVVYDDADLELGRLRVRPDGGAGGHNGVRSLIETLGRTDFARVRVGVRGSGRGESDLADYVLSPFDADEAPLVERAVDRAADAVECLVGQGVEAAMNAFNGVDVGSEGQDREV